MAAVITHIDVESPRRPQLQVIEGGRSRVGSPVEAPSIPWRLIAALGVVVLVGLSFVARANPEVPIGGSASATQPVSLSAGESAMAGSYTVQSGDSLWAIAVALDSPLDVRETVSVLSDANGGAQLVPGQVLSIPRQLR